MFQTLFILHERRLEHAATFFIAITVLNGTTLLRRNPAIPQYSIHLNQL